MGEVTKKIESTSTTVICPRCFAKKKYKILALPAGDMKYWKCPKCGWRNDRSNCEVYVK